MLCSSSGVVITKIINSTNAKSNSGVILISLNVTSEPRCEKRRMISSSFLLEIFSLDLRDQFLREIVQLDRQDAQVVHQPVIAKHGRNGDQQTGHCGNE